MTDNTNQTVHTEFAAITLTLKDILIDAENRCKNFEINSKKIILAKQIEFIYSLNASYKNMDQCFYKLWIIAKNFSRKQLDQNKKYFQNEVLSYFVRATTPLNHRIYSKPLGYGGDYVVMNYMYEDGYPGEDTYSKFVDRYTLYLPEARAHIFRRSYFKKLITNTIEEKAYDENLKIASFACGPAVEMLDILNEYKVPDNVQFFAVDGEPLALAQIEKNLLSIEKNKGRKFNVKTHHENVVNMVRRKTDIPGLDALDIAYSAGFFDYLSDRTCSMLIEYVYKRLNKGGIFIGVNIFEDHPCRLGMEMVGEWYLNHRDEKGMYGLARNIKDPEFIKIDFDPTKTNIYLIIKK